MSKKFFKISTIALAFIFLSASPSVALFGSKKCPEPGKCYCTFNTPPGSPAKGGHYYCMVDGKKKGKVADFHNAEGSNFTLADCLSDCVGRKTFPTEALNNEKQLISQGFVR
jgi:hypothetical protein